MRESNFGECLERPFEFWAGMRMLRIVDARARRQSSHALDSTHALEATRALDATHALDAHTRATDATHALDATYALDVLIRVPGQKSRSRQIYHGLCGLCCGIPVIVHADKVTCHSIREPLRTSQIKLAPPPGQLEACLPHIMLCVHREMRIRVMHGSSELCDRS